MNRVKVPLWGAPQKFVVIDLDAMNGAVLGENVFFNGRVLDPRQVLNDYVVKGDTIVAGSRGGGTRPPVAPGPRTTDDLNEGRFNLYFTVERAQDAVGAALTDSANVTLTYNDGGNTITGDLTTTGVTPGAYGDATHVARITCDAYGRIIAIEEIEITGGGGGGTWGGITGTLADQTDLQAALDDKADRDADQTFRTRSGNTGGGDIYTRNVLHGPVAYQWWCDTGGVRIFGQGQDGEPAAAWCFFIGTGPGGFGVDPLAIDLSTGEVNSPFLTSTTQSTGDNSTKVATTAYVDAATGNAIRYPGAGFENGSLALTGTLTEDVFLPYGGTITAWTIGGVDSTGSASIAVSYATYANFDTMTSLFTASLTSAKKAQASGLSHTLPAWSWVRFVGSSFSGIKRVSITLTVEP